VLHLLKELDVLFTSYSEGQIFPLQLSASVGVLPGEGLLSCSGQKEVIPFIGSEKHAVCVQQLNIPLAVQETNHRFRFVLF